MREWTVLAELVERNIAAHLEARQARRPSPPLNATLRRAVAQFLYRASVIVAPDIELPEKLTKREERWRTSRT